MRLLQAALLILLTSSVSPSLGQTQSCATQANPAVGCTDPAGRPCSTPCNGCCQPPCSSCLPPGGPPRRPRESYPPEQPRDAVPGIPRGAYAAPPQTGMIEGPRSGVELGGMSITLPELTLGLPKIRIHHRMKLFQQGQMRIAEATAPYVENPYYAYQSAMLQTAAAQTASQSRVAEPIDEEQPRDAEETPRPRDAEERSCLTSRDAAFEQRLDRLERCLELQCKAIDNCIQQMKENQVPHAYPGPTQAPPRPKVKLKPSPMQAPAPDVEEIPPPPKPLPQDLGFQPMPRGSQPIREVDQASYKQLLQAPAPALRRLPPTWAD